MHAGASQAIGIPSGCQPPGSLLGHVEEAALRDDEGGAARDAHHARASR